MKVITIRGNDNGKSDCVSSHVKHKGSQYGNEDFNPNVPEKLYDILLTEFLTQRKNEQVVEFDEQDVVLNVVPLQMIIPINVPKTRAKDTDIKKD